MALESTIEVLRQVNAERQAQEAKWGEQNHPDGTGSLSYAARALQAKYQCQQAAEEGRITYRHILEEEVWEAFAESDPTKLRDELIQVAAVAVAWVEKLDREGAA
jgi:hypothetical protein